MLQAAAHECIDVEAEEFIGTKPNERSGTRRDSRNGTRPRKLVTPAGEPVWLSAKMRQGSFPGASATT
ncbi:transposase [Corynebacterium phocae]|uniref:transposase n=1 Tax=Corynebacterium phocae TaxID=161895 RepID=UPI003CCC4400